MSNEHFYERLVIRDEPYLHTIEAATMQVALEILGEPTDTHGYENRRQVALTLFLDTNEAARFSRAFAWAALFNPAIRTQVFVSPTEIRPDLIDGNALRTLIRNAWNVVANVSTDQGE